MISNEIGRQLHHKAVLGAPLTAQEEAQLHQWYQQQDALEAQSLSSSLGANDVDTLRAQVDQALAELSAATRTLQEITAANDALRAENTALRERLAQPPEPQTA
jgi:septal ring factor EnvC (AmiA/AmiB activator)